MIFEHDFFGVCMKRLLWALALWTTTPSWGADLLAIYRQAVDTNPERLTSFRQQESRQEELNQAFGLLLPTVGASAGLARTELFNESARSQPDSTDLQYGLSASQPLYDASLLAGIERAKASRSQADAAVQVAEQQLLLSLTQAYFGILQAEAQLTFALKNKEAIARQLEQAKRRFEVGLITITDVQEAQARFDEAVAIEIAAQVGVADAKEALRRLAGGYFDQVALLRDNADTTPKGQENGDFWAEQALLKNPAVRQAQFAVEAARAVVSVRQADRLPTVNATAQLGGSHSSVSVIGRRNTAQIGVELRVPIYQGGNLSSRLRQAAFDYEATKQQLVSQQRQVVLQARQAFQNIVADTSRIQALRQTVVSSRSALDAIQAGFEVGTRTIVDVLDAERNLIAAERDLSLARIDQILNQFNLLQAAGALDEAALSQVNGWLDPAARSTPSRP